LPRSTPLAIASSKYMDIRVKRRSKSSQAQDEPQLHRDSHHPSLVEQNTNNLSQLVRLNVPS
jgi:hypothetical protein